MTRALTASVEVAPVRMFDSAQGNLESAPATFERPGAWSQPDKEAKLMLDHTDSPSASQKQVSPQKFYVYFFGQESDNYVKIGMTSGVKKRLAQLQTGNPQRLVVLRLLEFGDIETAREAEVLFQERYKKLGFGAHGEWYAVNPAALLMDVNFAIHLGNLLAESAIHDVPGTDVTSQGRWLSDFDDQPLYASWRPIKYGSAGEIEELFSPDAPGNDSFLEDDK